ncbi:DUF2867 domain-containing protein [Paraburkholderia adhaesiva]|uniref:DUF2867 domain-containing protein n=1 Tax=Paraburkholderia adhaesiva TaxID=2883244 RepID=UPI001F48F08F|nr:DUF2867 domain-containing protein [Paraburkholderia adhaesiva]
MNSKPASLELPSGARLVAEPERLNYLHTACRRLSRNMTAFEAYCASTARPSVPLQVAFLVRDKISSLFGVQTIRGFKGARPRSAPAVGQRLDFFTVEVVTDDQLVLTSRDTHLAVMISIDMTSSPSDPSGRWCHITASVETYNAFGKLYMLPVAPAHKLIVWKMLKSLDAASA